MGQWHSLIGLRPGSEHAESLDDLVAGKLHEIIYNPITIRCRDKEITVPFPMLLWNFLVRPSDKFPANPIRGRWHGWHVAVIGDYATDNDTFVPFPQHAKKVSAILRRCNSVNVDITAHIPDGYVAANHSRKEKVKLASGKLSGKKKRDELFYPPSCLSMVGLTFLLAASGDGRGGGDADMYILTEGISLEEAVETVVELACDPGPPEYYGLGKITQEPWYLDRRLIGRWAGCCVEIVPEEEVAEYKDLTDAINAIVAEEAGTPILVNGRALFPDLLLAPGKEKGEIYRIDLERKGTLADSLPSSSPVPVLRISYDSNLIGRSSKIHTLVLVSNSGPFILQQAGDEQQAIVL